MPNPLLPREQVHEWVDHIHANPDEHKAAITRLVRGQRRLAKFVDEGSKDLTIVSRKTPVYLVGVTARLFDLVGGRMKGASWRQVREAEQRVGGAASDLFPLDDGFAARVRDIEWRRQPYVLDEMAMSLFDDPEYDPIQVAKLFFLMWVVVEVLDENWTPPKTFVGVSAYVATSDAAAGE